VIATASETWIEANQRHLVASVEVMRAFLERHARRATAGGDDDAPLAAARDTQAEARRAMTAPPTIERLTTLFGLSPFERDLLLLCAAMELDGGFGALCASAQRDPQRPFPTLSLALAALPDPSWRALQPEGPLRRWKLLEIGAAHALTLGALRIDERILHYLAGVGGLDARLATYADPLDTADLLVPSHRAVADRLLAAWSHAATLPLPLVQLCGPDLLGKRAITVAACNALGLAPHLLDAALLPSAPVELQSLLLLWERETLLANVALVIDCALTEPTGAQAAAITRLAERMRGPVILLARERWPILRRPTIALDVPRPSEDEQVLLWHQTLGPEGAQLNGQVRTLTGQFSLGAAAILAAGAEARGQAGQPEGGDFGTLLWEACRTQARPALEGLAQRIVATAGWDDLVLPPTQFETLRQIAAQVRQRAQVYERWGFATRGARGLGIAALFAGPSGTGKTMAAEVLANELRLDLYRIDLSAVVSKYIGETEKNLRAVFDAADEGGAILLFDEADALFGKRSEVKDSHDRYANIEVGYLLQRMEAYRGLALLTTNLRGALDTAFLRRLRFVVPFPFPDAATRAEIWRRVFPQATPTERLDYDALARLNVAGGNIRTIALNAAFLAADAGEPVRMTHLLAAARSEYAKLEKPLTGSEIAGWVEIDAIGSRPPQ
jgi:hypothetical protein